MAYYSKSNGEGFAHKPTYTRLNWDAVRPEFSEWFYVWCLLAYSPLGQAEDKPDRLNSDKPD